MFKKPTTIFLSFVLALVSCNRGHSPVSSRREISAAEYEVFTAWIDANFTGKESVGKGVTRVVIFDTTESGDDQLLGDENGKPLPWDKTAESLHMKDPALQSSALDAFRKVNRKEAVIHRSLHPAIDYELVTSAQEESIFHSGDWPAFYKQFPGSQGLLKFSGVGFNKDGTQALFYISNSCGGLCGGGFYVIMEKRDGRWIVQKDIAMRVS